MKIALLGAAKADGEGEGAISLDPVEEIRYRYNLALQDFSRAGGLLNLKDWAGSVRFSQPAVESFTKALVAVFKVPIWGHGPSGQLLGLRDKFPEEYVKEINEIADMTRTLAPEHSRSTYGEPSRGLTPADIYSEAHAIDAFNKAKKAREVARKVLEALKIL